VNPDKYHAAAAAAVSVDVVADPVVNATFLDRRIDNIYHYQNIATVT
jgi:hypothetical protein